MPDNNNKTPAKPVWKRRWFRVTSVTAIVFVLILAVLPFVISNSMKSWLLDNGADNVLIEDIDFNPFTGTVAVKGLDIRIAGKSVASNSLVYLNISLTALLKKGIAIKAATIDKLVLDIERTADGKIRVGSLIIDPSSQTDEVTEKEIKEKISWWLKLNKISLSQWEIRYISPQLKTTLFIDAASLQDLSTRPGAQSAKLDLKARLNKSNINATIQLEELTPEVKADGDISLQALDLNEFSGFTDNILDKLTGLINMSGKFTVSVSSSRDIDASYTGNAGISDTDVNSKNFAIAGTELKWDGSLSLKTQADNSQQTIKLDGNLAATDLAISLPEILDATGNSLSWQGTVDFARIENPAPQNIKINGKLDAKKLSLALVEQKLFIQQQEISMDPQLSLQLSDGATSLSGTANILASGTRIEDTAKELTLLAISRLDINGINATALDKVSVTGIAIQGTKLIQSLKSEKPTLAINDATITDLNYTGNGVSIQKVALKKLTGSFVREKDGSIDISNMLNATENATNISSAKKIAEVKETQTKAEETTSATPFSIKINEVSVEDDSLLRFADKTVSPAFKSTLNIASLKFTDIDSSKPDQPIEIKLDGKLNTYATIAISGSVRPFKKQPGIDLKINLENQNMVSLSPYAIAATGYLIRAGQLNIDSTVVIKDGNIDAKNTLFMKKLKMDKADETIVKNSEASIGMPLDKALGLLRDRKDNIKLEIPITGKLDEVEFGTGQIINTALRKATTAGMKTYLLYAFQPYGALIIAGQAVGKQMGKISLDPVVFEAGKGELDGKQKDYLKKLGKVMQDRPKIDVQICAYTTIADLSIKKDSAKEKEATELSQRQKNKSFKLGQARQKAIKDFLISDFKINDGRLILCSPEYDDGKDASPRVELRI